jgi:hypothetical protein
VYVFMFDAFYPCISTAPCHYSGNYGEISDSVSVLWCIVFNAVRCVRACILAPAGVPYLTFREPMISRGCKESCPCRYCRLVAHVGVPHGTLTGM